ncbi:MAG TPA: hypothetical protein VMM92_16305 [Thermoanaerobaculia bacterium]|nr:hypothetical protein [Thermoanaerobaculia bacterium]
MKKSAKNLKLQLHRETLCFLEPQGLDAVAGAATNQRTVCGTCATCVVFQTHCLP